MGYNPAQSLRGFAASQPPLLVFTLCLMAFGLTMVVLAYLIGENELPNPDVRMDWNKFLKKVTELEICIPQKYVKNFNSSISSENSAHGFGSLFAMNSTYNFSAPRFVDQSKSMSAVLSNVVDQVTEDTADDTSTVNISVRIPLWISGDVNIMSSALSHLKGDINGKQLGLNGKLSTQVMNVTLSFPPLFNLSCEKWCHIIKEVCLTLHVSSNLLPRTRSPDKCDMGEILFQEGAVVDFVEREKTITNKICQDGARLHLDYIPNTKLTEMLSIHERSIVNLHLMHTSYFMFVMVMTLLCYALVKGRYRSPKSLSMEKLPLDA